jgi:hypothetical protein
MHAFLKAMKKPEADIMEINAKRTHPEVDK